MAHDTARGLHVWESGSDQFDHTELAENWATVEQILSEGAQAIETLNAVPSSGNFAGRLVMLSAANSGFPAWTIIRYDGTSWRVVGPFEILPTLPIAGNFAGRVIVLSGADGGFAAWDIVRYNGTSWGIVGGWASVSTGGGATNIAGMQTSGDIYVTSGARGIVLTDRTTGLKRRIYLDNGLIQTEAVT